MDILFKNNKLMRICNQRALAIKEFGPKDGVLLMQRLDELKAVKCLENLYTLPQAKCHELHGRQKGQFSVNLKHPYRLIFEPANDPVPYKEDGGLDLKNITAIKILGREDTHDKKNVR